LDKPSEEERYSTLHTPNKITRREIYGRRVHHQVSSDEEKHLSDDECPSKLLMGWLAI